MLPIFDSCFLTSASSRFPRTPSRNFGPAFYLYTFCSGVNTLRSHLQTSYYRTQLSRMTQEKHREFRLPSQGLKIISPYWQDVGSLPMLTRDLRNIRMEFRLPWPYDVIDFSKVDIYTRRPYKLAPSLEKNPFYASRKEDDSYDLILLFDSARALEVFKSLLVAFW